MLAPRPYQVKALDSLLRYFKYFTGNPCLEAPTASGKSLIQAMFIQHALTKYKNQKIMSLTHSKELIAQNYMELKEVWPDAPAGIYSAGLKSRETQEPIIFAGIQSIYKRAAEFGKFNIIFVDESHLIPVRTLTGMYRQFIDAMKKINPKLKVIGLTATPYRLDNGLLTHGDNALFTHIIYARDYGASIDELLNDNYLAPLTTSRVPVKFDTSDVKVVGGEFKKGEMETLMESQIDTTEQACNDIIQQGFEQDRKSWLLFGQSVDHAEQITEHMLDCDIPTKLITGDTHHDDRDQWIENFKHRSDPINCLVNINVLTTGFNAKCVDLLGMLRATASTSLYVQLIGRAMRTCEEFDKKDALILDYVGNIARHGPINDIKPPKKKGNREDSEEMGPLKECPNCIELIPLSCTVCPECGYEFPPKEVVVDTESSEEPILAFMEPEEMECTGMDFSRHKKAGKPDSIKVQYWCGIHPVCAEYICIWHGRGASRRAEHWLKKHFVKGNKADTYVAWTMNNSEPEEHIETIIEDLTEHAIKPEIIIVQRRNGYPSIASEIFAHEMEEQMTSQ